MSLTCGLKFSSTISKFRVKSSVQSISTTTDDLNIFRDKFIHLNDNQWNKIHQYCDLLTEWNSKINLISRKDIQLLKINHIIPSLSMSLIKKFEPGSTVIDVGTGGGLPGLIMAISFPETQFTLLDSNSKKITVVTDIATKLNLTNVNPIWSRAENIVDKYDYIIGRAVSAIPNFLDFSSHLIKPTINNKDNQNKELSNGLYYLKGGDFVDELKEAKIIDYQIFPISKLLSINSDKSVLYIPTNEISQFYQRKLLQG